MKRIKIKAWFGDWHEVTEAKAREFVQGMMERITTRSTFEGKAELIDGTHLRGITCKELLKAYIDVTISHFIAGQGISYTEDIGTCWTYLNDLQNPAGINRVIDAYCETLAEHMVRYDDNEQDYVVEFWYNGEHIGKALLSDYADFMTD